MPISIYLTSMATSCNHSDPERSCSCWCLQSKSFRPIALRSCLGKIFTLLVKRRWDTFLASNTLLNTSVQKAFSLKFLDVRNTTRNSGWCWRMLIPTNVQWRSTWRMATDLSHMAWYNLLWGTTMLLSSVYLALLICTPTCGCVPKLHLGLLSPSKWTLASSRYLQVGNT